MKPSFKYFPLVMSLLLNLNAHARVFFVNNTNDSTAATSLRGAIIAANNNTDRENMIILGAPPQKHHVYRLTISGADEFAGLTGDLNVNRGNLFIEGYTTNVTIDATGLGDRVFQVSGPTHLTLENLIITGGASPTGSTNFPDGEFGGAIENFATLSLNRCIVTNNTSGDGQYIGENAPSTNSSGSGGGGPITIGGPPFEPPFGSGGGEGVAFLILGR